MTIDCDEIINGRLWVGSYIRTEEVGSLWQMGITTVLSLQSDRDLEDYGISLKKLSNAYDFAKIEFRRVPTVDFDRAALSANLSKGVEELESALLPDRAKVYLHCTAGVNRAPTVAAAYLIRVKGLSALEAYDYVCMKRHCSPYLDVLETYEADLRVIQ